MSGPFKRLSVLMATAFIDMVGFAIVFPLLPYYARRLDAADWMIGWIWAVFSIAQLAAAPIWGRLSDRFGRKAMIILGLGASAVAFVVFGLATAYWMLFLSRLIQGFGGGTVGVLQAYVADVTEPKDRARALGWLSASTNAGVAIGPAIGSLAFELGPAAPGLIAAGLCLGNILFASRWLPESRPQREEHVGRERRSVRMMITDTVLAPRGDVARLVWIYAVGMLGFMSMTAVLALYLQDAFGITETSIGPFFVYVGVLGIVMRAIVLGRLVDWLGETKVMRLGAALLALGLFTIPFPGGLLYLAVVIGLVPIGTACLFPSVTALVTHRAHAHERGQVLGVQQTFGGVARVIAPIWATAVFQSWGGAVPFYISGGVVAFVALLAFRVTPTAAPTEATAPP
ncbi:MAG: MFS transporter [Gemmatimonadales bacterium]